MKIEGAPDLVDLTAEAVKNATLFANRSLALQSWNRGSRVAEIGVAFGSFSRQIIDRTAPVLFDAYDLFQLHKIETLWGRPSAEIFDNMTQREYYEKKFSNERTSGQMRLFEGDSSSQISARGSDAYDIIYIDGDHSPRGVVKDTQAAISVLSTGGMLVFNDYILYDKQGFKYGVVPVVNDLCRNQGWKVFYLALNVLRHCDRTRIGSLQPIHPVRASNSPS